MGIREHTPLSYVIGLLCGLALIGHALYSVKRGYVLRQGGGYFERTQAPYAFWTDVLVGLVLGCFVVVICGMALWQGLAW